MTLTSIVFFLIGAIVLWGGLGVTLTMLLKNERKESLSEEYNN
ncbi:MetS family NSS transporter small subunit [Clostridium sp. Ade.TY]|nr:MetS family NSS transporter small subunit [Clostridium sp. Ade.TY]